MSVASHTILAPTNSPPATCEGGGHKLHSGVHRLQDSPTRIPSSYLLSLSVTIHLCALLHRTYPRLLTTSTHTHPPTHTPSSSFLRTFRTSLTLTHLDSPTHLTARCPLYSPVQLAQEQRHLHGIETVQGWCTASGLRAGQCHGNI